MSTLSVFEPIPVAAQRSKRLLFEPFQLRKWLRLGFCAFLMGSLPIAGLSGSNTSFNTDSDQGQGSVDSLGPWLEEHLTTLLILAAITTFVVLLLVLLGTWLSSRARFMLLDGVVRNRGAIAAPWRDYRREGNSLFRCRVALGMLSVFVLAMISGVMVLFNRSGWQSGQFSPASVISLAIGTFLIVAWFLLMELLSVVLMDFIVPTMFLHRLPVIAAGKRVLKAMLRDHPASLVLYLIARLLLNGAIATLGVLAIFLTCFIALVPYIGSVILLPLTIFQITYPLAFLEQLGPEWRILPQARHSLDAA
jgi:hypothetical protein